jgi:branched-chain amino acid transport system permease protein
LKGELRLSNFLQVLIDGILSGLLYALVAAGLSMIWGVMDVINFAHGEFLMVAMYICYWLGFILGIDPLFSWIAAGIFLFFLGALTYKIIIKNSLGKAAMAPLLATFGLSMLLKNLCLNRFTPNFRLLSGTIMEAKTFPVGGAIVSVPQLVTAIFALVVLIALYWLVKRTRIGWAIQATAMDKEAAELMGIDTEKIYLLVFGLGGACVGVAGGLMTTYLAVHPEVGSLFSLIAFVVVALGGFGSIPGALFAALLIGLVESFAGFYIAAVVKYVAVFAIYLVVILIRPKGLFGW